MSLLLGIESSCDETAASVVKDGCSVLSSIVASQDELHLEFGGVVPEIASRAHLERILPVIQKAIQVADVSLDELDAIAVGNRPGLIGSLLVGVSAAKALAWSLGKPLICVDHILAHLWAPSLSENNIEYPSLGLVVSGGHTSLVHLEDPLRATCIGRTIDDAAGEAFDKAAQILQLGWPGGQRIDDAAKQGIPSFQLPRPKTKGNRPDFSFSGLKTALLYGVRGTPKKIDGQSVFPREAIDWSKEEIANWAASFQLAAIDVIMNGVRQAVQDQPVRCLVTGGGVLSNSLLRRRLIEFAEEHGLSVHIPAPSFCVDNAAMIAGLGHYSHMQGHCDPLSMTASPRGIAS